MSVISSVGDAVGSAVFAVTNYMGIGEFGTVDKQTEKNRFESFVPQRDNCHARWYVDGKDYYYAVSEALMNAKEEIFIEDLWLSPELYLRRPPSKNEEYRLDRILNKKAKEGVKVYVFLYQDFTLTSPYDSEHSEEVLKNLDKNIHVQRHPEQVASEGGVEVVWTHHEKIIVIDRHLCFMGGFDLCFGRYDTQAHQVIDFHNHSKNFSVWPGQDYSNPRIMDFLEVKTWAKTLVDKKNSARMPWHDIGLGFTGQIVNDLSRHFIQRWNYNKKKEHQNNELIPLLIAKSIQQSDREISPQVKSYSYFEDTFSCHPYEGTSNVQLLRSISKWSHGIETEHSIQNAYIKAIEESQHFIYIENQYFITNAIDDPKYNVKNLIGKAIVDRITKAHKNNEKFQIIVVIPLFAGYNGDVDTSNPKLLPVRLILHHQLLSISRGEHSIFEALKKNGVTDPKKYIGFYSLRAHDKLDPQIVKKGLGRLKEENEAEQVTEECSDSPVYITELLYIHSKLMIVDDKIVICGSANLNDRSQTGCGDSEIAAYIEDKDFINSKMAGKDWKAGKFAATLRRHIFKEHLGLLNDNDHEKVTTFSYPPPFPINIQGPSNEDNLVLDPASDEFNNLWKQTATVNTEVFRKVFHCVPDDTVSDWESYKKFIEGSKYGHVYNPDKITNEEVEAELSKVKGHLVYYPLEFLSKVKLDSVIEYVIPDSLYKSLL